VEKVTGDLQRTYLQEPDLPLAASLIRIEMLGTAKHRTPNATDDQKHFHQQTIARSPQGILQKAITRENAELLFSLSP
jgi:hypothetical protein